MRTRLLIPFAVVVGLVATPARSEVIGGNPGPAHNYICPHADGKPALDTEDDHDDQLSTMSSDVKAIEVLEFG
jgi:hypothetical protein